jgi:hypothetical protein
VPGGKVSAQNGREKIGMILPSVCHAGKMVEKKILDLQNIILII